MRPSWQRSWILAALCVAGCATRFNPRAEPRVAASSAAADASFGQARRTFEAARWPQARTEFERFIEQFPSDPLVPFAHVYIGRSFLEQADYPHARAELEALVQNAPERAEADSARFYLGLTQAKLGRCDEAETLLRTMAQRIAPGEDALRMHVFLGECQAKAGHLAEALRHWGDYFSSARDSERDFARHRSETLVQALSPEQALALYRSSPERSLARAVLGPKATVQAGTTLDPGAQTSMVREVAQLREQFGFEGAPEREHRAAAAVDTRVIGCVLPLSGTYQQQGQHALRGAAMALEVPGPGRWRLAIRDSGGEKSRASRAVEELVTEEGAIAVVGPLERTEAEAAAASAEALGVPLASLSVATAPTSGPYVFYAMHKPAARIRALLGQARAQGARLLAVLYPETSYGRKMRDLFAASAEQSGMGVTVKLGYDGQATSFSSQIRQLRSLRFDALFIPDAASRLELIAPALAAADLWPSPVGAPRPKTGRQVLLLSLAENLSAKVLREARYLQGSLLAPGYYPSGDTFVEQYRALYEEDPTLFEAFAFDAVRAIKSAVEAGATDRAALASKLSHQEEVVGLTGAIRFGTDGNRADPAAVYTVAGDVIRKAD